MGDERNDREMREPSQDDLERAEAEFFAELAKDRPVPFDRMVVRADVLEAARPEDYIVSDLFGLEGHYLEDDGRISHVQVLWRGEGGKPTHLLEWWAPYVLLRPEELAEAEYVGDLDHLIVERGVSEGAIVAKEIFLIEPPEEAHRVILGLEPEERVMYVVSDYRDQSRRSMLIKRQVLASGMVTRFRDLAFEKRHGGLNEYEI